MVQKIIALALLSGLILLAATVSTELSLGSNLRSLTIVLGGTFLATLIAYPWRRFIDLAATLKTAFGPPTVDVETHLAQLIRLARLYRFKGPRELDYAAQRVGDDLLRFGAELVADGKSRAEVSDALERECELRLSRLESQINILQTMSRLAPAFGLAGTLIGLIKMFGRITNPSELGVGMSVALLTTFYGIIIANLVLTPLSRKLKEFARAEATIMSLTVEGVLSMVEHDHPASIDHRLRTQFMPSRPQAAGAKSRSRGVVRALPAPERRSEARPARSKEKRVASARG